MSRKKTKVKETMYTCGDCAYAELQCPPIVRCKLTGKSMYLDSPACKRFKKYEEE
jgi:hypothetical protein